MLFQTEKLSSFHCCKLWILLYFFVNIESIASELQCDPIPPPVNGIVDCSYANSNPIGSTCYFGCNPGFTISSQVHSSYCAYNFALRKPMWSPPSPPECKLHPKVEKECYEDSRIDMVFVLDGSGSISSESFELVKTWTKKVGEHMIKVFGHHLHMGIVQFSNNAQVESKIYIFPNTAQFDMVVDNINQLDDDTNTVDGMNEALEVLNVYRPKCPGDYQKIMVLLTDGHSSIDSSGLPNAARMLQDADVVSFAVGVESANHDEIRIIANDREDRIFKIEDFDFLHETAHDAQVGVAKTLGISCDQERIAPKDGDVSCTHGEHLGSLCTYTCNPGYTISDPSLSTTYCKVQTTGVGGWSSIPPMCIEDCENRNNNCDGWKKLYKYCETTNRFYSYMARTCPKACGFCK